MAEFVRAFDEKMPYDRAQFERVIQEFLEAGMPFTGHPSLRSSLQVATAVQKDAESGQNAVGRNRPKGLQGGNVSGSSRSLTHSHSPTHSRNPTHSRSPTPTRTTSPSRASAKEENDVSQGSVGARKGQTNQAPLTGLRIYLIRAWAILFALTQPFTLPPLFFTLPPLFFTLPVKSWQCLMPHCLVLPLGYGGVTA